jgi:Zn-finger nucleic acid-binding protein
MARSPSSPEEAAAFPQTSGQASVFAPFPCPRCGTRTCEKQAGERPVFLCEACGGIWIDNLVAQHIVRASERNTVRLAEEASRAAVRAVDTRPALRCPVCSVPLLRVAVAAGAGKIELDVCREHGTWFDRDELPLVARALVKPQTTAVRTEANTVTENLSNAFSNAGRAARDFILEAVRNFELRGQNTNSSWWNDWSPDDSTSADDREAAHGHHGGGFWDVFDGGSHHHGGSSDNSGAGSDGGGHDQGGTSDGWGGGTDTDGGSGGSDGGGGHHD